MSVSEQQQTDSVLEQPDEINSARRRVCHDKKDGSAQRASARMNWAEELLSPVFLDGLYSQRRVADRTVLGQNIGRYEVSSRERVERAGGARQHALQRFCLALARLSLHAVHWIPCKPRMPFALGFLVHLLKSSSLPRCHCPLLPVILPIIIVHRRVTIVFRFNGRLCSRFIDGLDNPLRFFFGHIVLRRRTEAGVCPRCSQSGQGQGRDGVRDGLPLIQSRRLAYLRPQTSVVLSTLSRNELNRVVRLASQLHRGYDVHCDDIICLWWWWMGGRNVRPC